MCPDLTGCLNNCLGKSMSDCIQHPLNPVSAFSLKEKPQTVVCFKDVRVVLSFALLVGFCVRSDNRVKALQPQL